jgi:DNA-binding response OmpR family regulator
MCDMMDISQSQATASKGSVLIVDDNARLRSTMGEMIKQEGYSVEQAGTGEDALELLKRKPFDLMTVDMVMPGMSGAEVVQHARQIRPDLSIIVITAHPTIESAIASIKADVTDYLLKPCTLDDLTLVIGRAMQERARQQKRQRLLDMVGDAIDHLRQSDEPSELVALAETPTALPSPSANVLRVGLLTLDREKRLVTLNVNPPRSVELTEGETAILTTLMETPNQVFTYGQLADKALGYKDMDRWTVESVTRSAVFRLRQKIEASPDGPHLIRTVRGRGYFFSPA